jgi:hypothetical protein
MLGRKSVGMRVTEVFRDDTKEQTCSEKEKLKEGYDRSNWILDELMNRIFSRDEETNGDVDVILLFELEKNCGRSYQSRADARKVMNTWFAHFR